MAVTQDTDESSFCDGGAIGQTSSPRGNGIPCESVVQTAPDGFMLFSLKGKILKVNDGYSRMNGYTKEELSQLCIADVQAVEGPADTEESLARIVAQEGDVVESCHRRKDGSSYPVEVCTHHICEGGGYFVSFIRDISHRRLVEERLLLAQHTLNNMADMFIWLDEQGRYIFVNQSACRMLGYSEKELLSMRIYDVDPTFDEPRWR